MNYAIDGVVSATYGWERPDIRAVSEKICAVGVSENMWS